MSSSSTISTTIIPSVARSRPNSRQVRREFEALVNAETPFRVAGLARKDPGVLLKNRLFPAHKIELFETRFYLTNALQIPELRFVVAYVVQKNAKGKLTIFPRIFYKDLSLAWRSASHFAYENDGDIWIGKGDVRGHMENGDDMVESIESTTDLPLEMQSAVEGLLGLASKTRKGSEKMLQWILRQGPSDRVEPYHDFVAPRQKAAANPRNLINRGRPVAWFSNTSDPTSLKFTRGFEPDFSNGIVERSTSRSKLYGGKLRRFRILSTNEKIQYYFIAGPKHVWIIPPQATTTQISSYGVRTIDVIADDDLFIPGWEYHHFEETQDGLELYSQIPPGFAGEVCPHDDAKADASPWLDQIPIIQQFRRDVLN